MIATATAHVGTAASAVPPSEARRREAVIGVEYEQQIERNGFRNRVGRSPGHDPGSNGRPYRPVAGNRRSDRHRHRQHLAAQYVSQL